MRNSFVFFKSFREACKRLPNKQRLAFYDAVCDFALYEEEPQTLTGAAELIFISIRQHIEANNRKFENGKKGGRPKKETTEETTEETTGYKNEKTTKKPYVDVDVDVDKNEDENAPQKSGNKPTRKKYGKYGWVKLTAEEYSRLMEEFGKDVFIKYGTYVDELAQQTENKYKWKDWNLVIRKAIRENWGDRSREKTSGERIPYDGVDLLE